MDNYSEEAQQFLEELLCLDVSVQSEEAVAVAHTFTPREGYRTVFTGIFTDVSSVTVDGKAVTYYPAFFGKRNGDFYNSIVLEEATCEDVVVTATWGFTELPADLAKLLTNAGTVVSQSYVTKDVKSKRVEDFQVTYGDLSDDEVFTKQNAVTIAKYSLCNVGNIQHGETCYHGRFCSVC